MTFVLKDTEVLVNCCYGGFSFSHSFIDYLVKKGYTASNEEFWSIQSNMDPHWSCPYTPTAEFWKYRTDPVLIGHVRDFESTGVTSGSCSNIRIMEIPAYHIPSIWEYDGSEGLEFAFPWECLARASLDKLAGKALTGDRAVLMDAIDRGLVEIPEEKAVA